MDSIETNVFEVDGVSVDLSPQFVEVTDWLRGHDLFERQLPPGEIEYGLGARRKAVIQLVGLYLLEVRRQNETLKATGDGHVDLELALERACTVGNVEIPKGETLKEEASIERSSLPLQWEEIPFVPVGTVAFVNGAYLGDRRALIDCPTVEYIVDCPRCKLTFGV